jgi:hypothetical protein
VAATVPIKDGARCRLAETIARAQNEGLVLRIPA